jgi:hypothetical protein
MIQLIGIDGVNSISNEILEGIIPKDIPRYPKILLQQLARVRATLKLDISEHDMCQGFLKWREKLPPHRQGNIWEYTKH